MQIICHMYFFFFFTFNPLADAFIQANLQMREQKQSKQQRATICQFCDKSQLV